MKRLSGWFYRISTGKVTLAAFLIFAAAVSFLLPAINRSTGSFDHGIGTPDTQFFYSTQTLLHMAEIYGQSGRNNFVLSHWTYDLAFPIFYTIFLLMLSSFLLKKLSVDQKRFFWLNLLPILTMFFDLGENAITSIVMKKFPMNGTFTLGLAPVFTSLKWVLFFFCVLQVFISLLLWIKKMVQSHVKPTISL